MKKAELNELFKEIPWDKVKTVTIRWKVLRLNRSEVIDETTHELFDDKAYPDAVILMKE